MEDMLELFFVFICLGVSFILKTAKNARRRTAEEDRVASAAAQSRAQARTQETPRPAQTVLPPLSFGDAPGQIIAPTVHPHVAPDCKTHDAPGSLGVTSTEGKDPCHEDELTLTRTTSEVPQSRGGLTFDWSGENMVKAFVMQEVLTRPAQRRRA